MYYQFGYLDVTVFQVMSLMYFTTVMVCYSILVFLWRLLSSSEFILVQGHSGVLGNYILFILPLVTMMAGYSILGFYAVDIMHSSKFIRTQNRFT